MAKLRSSPGARISVTLRAPTRMGAAGITRVGSKTGAVIASARSALRGI